MEYIYKIRRKSDGRFFRYRLTEINRQIRRGHPFDYWGSEKKGKKFYSLPDTLEYISKEPELQNDDIEIVPFEVITTYVECESIPYDNSFNHTEL